MSLKLLKLEWAMEHRFCRLVDILFLRRGWSTRWGIWRLYGGLMRVGCALLGCYRHTAYLECFNTMFTWPCPRCGEDSQ